MKQAAIGIDLGGTVIKGVIINNSGELLKESYKSSEGDIKKLGIDWKQQVKELIQELKNQHPEGIEAIGIAAPGLPNAKNNAIAFMPGRLEGLENFVWEDFLNEGKITIINDAQAALMAESRFGAGKNYQNIVMLTLGTGVGGAILINGSLYTGNSQMAGHLGHMTITGSGNDVGITGMPGSLEQAIGNCTISKRSFGRYNSTHELVADFLKGNYFASYIWLDSIRNLALAIASIENAISPNLIILGGGILQAEKALLDPLQEFLEIFEWRPGGKKTEIKVARFSNLSGAIGAAGFALEKFKNN